MDYPPVPVDQDGSGPPVGTSDAQLCERLRKPVLAVHDREDPVWLQHPIRPESELAQQRERPLIVRGVGDDGIHAAQSCERPLEWTVVELDAKVRGRRREGGALPPLGASVTRDAARATEPLRAHLDLPREVGGGGLQPLEVFHAPRRHPHRLGGERGGCGGA